MNILLLSSGGGGGNILRSLKTMFRRDLLVTQKSDPKYTERLRRAVTTRFLDTNEFSLLDVPKEERFLIGAATTRRLGSMHNPEVASAALEESRHDVESLLGRFSVIVLIATGGKGTGAGTMFPLAQMAREQKKLVIPIFVRPSFERHEVEKRRYDHALKVTEQFDAARIRLMEILNDRGYVDTDPQPQSAVWERMNRPIAGGLAWATLCPFGPVPGGSLGLVRHVCRQRAITDRLFGNRPRCRAGSKRRAGSRRRSRLLGQLVLCVWRACRHVPYLRSGRLVECR